MSFDFQAPGVVSAVVIGNPAAGADFTTVVPGNQIWNLIGVQLLFTTDANAANRRVIIEIADSDGGQMVSCLSSFDHAASLAYFYSFYRGAEAINDASTGTEHAQMPFPHDLILEPGATIRSDISAIQAGDQISAIRLNRSVYLSPF